MYVDCNDAKHKHLVLFSCIPTRFKIYIKNNQMSFSKGLTLQLFDMVTISLIFGNDNFWPLHCNGSKLNTLKVNDILIKSKSFFRALLEFFRYDCRGFMTVLGFCMMLQFSIFIDIRNLWQIRSISTLVKIETPQTQACDSFKMDDVINMRQLLKNFIKICKIYLGVARGLFLIQQHQQSHW